MWGRDGDTLINISDFNINSIFEFYNNYNLSNIDIIIIFVSVIVLLSLAIASFIFFSKIDKVLIDISKFKNIINKYKIMDNINDKKSFGLAIILKYLEYTNTW